MAQQLDLSTFTSIVEARDILKVIQKLSWKISQFENRYKFEAIDPQNYEDYFNSYLTFLEELETEAEAARLFLEGKNLPEALKVLVVERKKLN